LRPRPAFIGSRVSPSGAAAFTSAVLPLLRFLGFDAGLASSASASMMTPRLLKD
jgi:hypothetical protein